MLCCEVFLWVTLEKQKQRKLCEWLLFLVGCFYMSMEYFKHPCYLMLSTCSTQSINNIPKVGNLHKHWYTRLQIQRCYTRHLLPRELRMLWVWENLCSHLRRLHPPIKDRSLPPNCSLTISSAFSNWNVPRDCEAAITSKDWWYVGCVHIPLTVESEDR